jgi:hypothetical protein
MEKSVAPMTNQHDISLLVAVAVFYIGQKTIESDVSDEEIIAEVTR